MHFESLEIDREAIAFAYRAQNVQALDAAVVRGEWTRGEADRAHEAFMQSDLLQTFITRDIWAIEAMLKGQVH